VCCNSWYSFFVIAACFLTSTMLSSFLQCTRTRRNSKGSSKVSAKSRATSSTDLNSHRKSVLHGGRDKPSSSRGARACFSHLAQRQPRMLAATEDHARLREQMKIVAEQGVCQTEAAKQTYELHAKDNHTNGRKKPLSGEELVQALNAAVQMAYFKGEFYREHEHDSTSSTSTGKALQAGNSATNNGGSSNTPSSLCGIQGEACISL